MNRKRLCVDIVPNPKGNRELARGFTHRMVFEGGGFLFLHKKFVAEEKCKLRERKNKKLDWVIYIPEEGHWPIKGKHVTRAQARDAYLKWADRKRLPAGSHISQGTF